VYQKSLEWYIELMKEKKMSKKIDSFAEKATLWIGSPVSLILHTLLFAIVLSLPFFGFPLEKALLILTTAVSLEAIYLALFIQMSINRNTAQLEAVEEDLEDIQEDVEEIGEDMEEIQKDVEEISEDIEEISEDMEGIEKNVKEISEDVEEIQEDVAELEESADSEIAREQKIDGEQQERIAKIEILLSELKKELGAIKK